MQGPFSAQIFDPAAVLRRKNFMISAQIFQIVNFCEGFIKKICEIFQKNSSNLFTQIVIIFKFYLFSQYNTE